MTSVFDDDTAVVAVGDGRWRGEATDRWTIAGVPNGGYLMSIVLGAILTRSQHPDPLTVTGHYLRRTRPGPVDIHAETIKEGRSLTTMSASLVQDDREALRILATLGDLDAMEGPTAIDAEPPDVGPLTDLHETDVDRSVVHIADRFEYRMREEKARGAVGEPSGTAHFDALIRFADEREPDARCLPTIADAFPPTVYQLGHYGWTPTLELTVHFRGRPAVGWLLCVLRTRFLERGLLEEDGEIWDSSGRIVALSRQMALASVPQG